METVHKEVKEANSCKNKPLAGSDTSETEDEINGEDESESQCLLPPRKGGMSRNTEKARRKVKWNDTNGNNLAEVLEYEPSEVSEAEDDDSEDSCICSVM
ncbi:PREDICTED: uncharacterized protein LOC104816000 [Tarenaya hassleriana]|uniref:uncharacterized protein LOC104816000 n=1 Tax=Tarenaya hassleriana TaxID=28532 RepID=UPI00053C67B0|nr:PREDICTED: uncharacterized protein LOC104816000 [Tarenaya hassleriana]XP_010542955.1 PREDICTED: uncharacterized protein LOC104816000 [Tarenaya hassleriana]XP_010542956.1 PREDICTED: uncharacterized protein LOC104816000 [Tarenaya hassleriana]XP_010542957.1 PREDICTED: uncharacterized protein LOC104816000 [Tarenaya hassleriana]